MDTIGDVVLDVPDFGPVRILTIQEIVYEYAFGDREREIRRNADERRWCEWIVARHKDWLGWAD